MARVACLLDEGFDDFELREAVKVLAREGHLVDIIGMEEGEVLHGIRGEVEVRVTAHINKVLPQHYSAVLVPGGSSAASLCEDPRFYKFVNHMEALGRSIFAIGEGSKLLRHAGILREGRSLTAAPPLQDWLRETGAEVLHQPVVVDGNWVTARQTTDLPRFCELMVRVLEGNHPELPGPNRSREEVPRY
ncbi:MAG TPA: DJ-1/PfpI family protein [Myxococcaceae bacterium]|nr:DJ-1/PfpI family protein [Myxococcaceae bacterium]